MQSGMGFLQTSVYQMSDGSRTPGSAAKAVLMKDARIRYNEAEKIAVMRFGVQCFCLSRQDLPAADMANRFIRNIDRIADACFRSTGGFILVVDEARLRRVL